MRGEFALFLDEDNGIVGRAPRAKALSEQVSAIDPRAFADPESWWSAAFAQLEGRLGVIPDDPRILYVLDPASANVLQIDPAAKNTRGVNSTFRQFVDFLERIDIQVQGTDGDLRAGAPAGVGRAVRHRLDQRQEADPPRACG